MTATADDSDLLLLELLASEPTLLAEEAARMLGLPLPALAAADGDDDGEGDRDE